MTQELMELEENNKKNIGLNSLIYNNFNKNKRKVYLTALDKITLLSILLLWIQ